MTDQPSNPEIGDEWDIGGELPDRWRIQVWSQLQCCECPNIFLSWIWKGAVDHCTFSCPICIQKKDAYVRSVLRRGVGPQEPERPEIDMSDARRTVNGI